jgi:uncharacterized membrane protein SpoIIM required for sporulation
MKQAPFEAAHAREWQEFEAYLENQPSFDPGEMPARFRRLCQSLALAAERRYTADLVERLHRLALRGHHALYLNRRRESQQVLEFILAGFPRLVRQEWRLVLAATLLFFGPMLGLIALLQQFPDFAHYLLAPEQIASYHQMYDPSNRRIGMREADTNVLMFGFYIWNNVRIGFQTFAGGMLAGVGSAWFLGANGTIIGAVAGYLTQAGFGQTFWSFVAGHSSLELLAIVLSGAAGFKLGLAVIAPGNLTRKAALVAAARPAVRIMYGAAVMFFGAAFVEAFWSPVTEVDFLTKIIVGVSGWVVLLAYFLFAGRARAAH